MVDELASLHSVVNKAQNCARQGGNLLVCGIANAQLNAVLNSCDLLIGYLRRTLTTLSNLTEKRFEQLVYRNMARTDKTEWVSNYNELNSILFNLGKLFDELNKLVSNLRSQANSLTLLEQFQQAKEEINDFMIDARHFAESTAYLIGMNYSEPPKPIIVKAIESPEEDSESYQLDFSQGGQSEIVDLSPDKLLDLISKDPNFPKFIGAGAPELPHGNLPNTRWFYFNKMDGIKTVKQWVPYDQKISDLLEREWSNGQPESITIGDKVFNLKDYKEGSLMLKKDIRRGTWFWLQDDDPKRPTEWVPYDHQTAAILEDVAQTYGKFVVQVQAEIDKKTRIIIGTVYEATQHRLHQNARPGGRKVRRGYQ